MEVTIFITFANSTVFQWPYSYLNTQQQHLIRHIRFCSVKSTILVVGK